MMTALQLFFQLMVLFYNINIYKYVALLIGYKDKEVTLMYNISCLTFLLGSFVISHIWDKYKETITMGFCLGNLLLLMIYINLTMFYPKSYLYTLIYA